MVSRNSHQDRKLHLVSNIKLFDDCWTPANQFPATFEALQVFCSKDVEGIYAQNLSHPGVHAGTGQRVLFAFGVRTVQLDLPHSSRHPQKQALGKIPAHRWWLAGQEGWWRGIKPHLGDL